MNLQQRAELAEFLRRQEQRAAYALLSLMFGLQAAFFNDPAKRKAAVCSRRAGKTEGIGIKLLDLAAKHPGDLFVYIALTRGSAKRLLWPVLKKLNDKRNLGISFNNTDLTATLPNGAQIWLTGADDKGQIDKLRGIKARVVVVDEAASFGELLDELVDEVLEPTLLDLDGELWLTGTPNAACVGKFHDVTTNPDSGWSVHHWTVLDNPFIPHAARWLEGRKKANNWTDDHPVYLREWLGRWVRSLDSLVFKLDKDRDCYSGTLPQLARGASWSHVLGVDLGFDDACAIEVASFAYGHPNTYLHDGWKESGLTIDGLTAKLATYVETWKPIRIKMDTGGLGKMIAASITERYNIPIEPAEKSEKMAIIELVNSDLKSSRLKVQNTNPLVSEWHVLQWDEKRRKEDERYANHCSDAALYAYREARHWTYEAKQALPPEGTPERGEIEEERMERAALEAAEAEEDAWWERSIS